MSNGPDERAAAPARLTAAQANDAWMKLIGRYDFYNGSVNTKAALLVAFNTFVGGGIVLKWKDIHDAFGTEKVAFILASLFLLVALAASLVSLWFTFRSVNPFLGPPVIPNDYHSLLFFGDVRKFSAENYHEQLAKLIHAFKHYYLKRASWKSQEEFKIHVRAPWPEYNHRYAHPFEWTWTNQKLRQWFAKHAPNSLQIL